MNKDLKKIWSTKATKEFKDKKVKEISWMSEKEREEFGWFHSAPIIIFEDGTYIIASKDDEGNDAGALFTSSTKIPILPVV